MKKIMVLLMVVLIVGCTQIPKPIPTPDANSLSTQIAATIIAGVIQTQQAIPSPITPLTPTQKPTESVIESIPDCSQALIGENVTCRVSHAYCSYKPNVKGAPTFCNDAPYPGHNFTLLRWGEDWSQYNGKCLIVTGYIHLYQGIPEIEATSKSQVKICE